MKQIPNSYWEFLKLHRTDDPVKLLFQQQRFPDVDLRWVAQQIEGQRQARKKWPLFSRCEKILYPPKLNREQSSSEQAALYKSQLIPSQGTLADLTGGFGVDDIFFAQRAKHVYSVERDDNLSQLVAWNAKELRLDNLTAVSDDSINWLKSQEQFSMLYLDPARRDSHNKKVVAFEDCEPNILELLSELFLHTSRLLIKASPMIEIRAAIQQLGCVEEVHIFAHKGECKEVLFLCLKDCKKALKDILIHCVDCKGDDLLHEEFTFQQEEDCPPAFAQQLGRYLYEPSSSMMKGGCYNLLSQKYGLESLSRNTHLYTSNQLAEHFPGRVFELLQPMKPDKKTAHELIPQKKAHVSCRNYPVSAPDLQKKLSLSEGGELYVWGFSLGSKPQVWLCRLVRD